jgi:hypothetical protein
MDEINLIIDNLINYNKDLQIDTMIKLCNTNPSSHLCRNITDNNYSEWKRFFTIDNNKNLFSKGTERLDTWKHLMLDNSSLFFSKVITPNSTDEELMKDITSKLIYLKENKIYSYYFIFASLIIIFQVFGDGNHRTAQYFMKIMRAPEISMRQMREINNLLYRNDYYIIIESPIKRMNYIINEIISISELHGGQKKKYKKIKRKTKNKKKPSKQKSKKLK